MKKLMLLAAVLLAASPMSAYDFEVDGVYYDVISLTDLTCKITHNGNYSGIYQGDFVIPQTVDYSNKTLTVVEIGNGAFSYCYDLTSVTIPSIITKIGDDAFAFCKKLTNVTIPNSVTEIGSFAFRECVGLENITIPSSVTKIGSYAFFQCSALTSIKIPDSVTELGYSAFSECTELASVTLSNSIAEISERLFVDCTALTNVIIPDAVKEIGESAFGSCTNITNITIPDAVKTINRYAFSNCTALTNVTLGSSIRTIGSRVFDYCNSLSSISSLATTPPDVESDNFTNNQHMTMNVYVPQESVEAYKKADVWKNFWYITVIGSEPEVGGGSMEKCANPTIDYANGKLTFSCATSGATCVSDITDADIKLYTTNEVQLGVTYNISVYATKAGYVNSDMVTATLCWIEAEPKTEGIGNGVAQIQANAVLIQSRNGQIEISGLDDGTKVAVYGVNGTQFGSAVSYNGSASIHTGMERGGIAIVKIGDRSIKVLMK